ncbi:PQQ-dependent catabolism-associated CXXCW motif protein [Novispirillum sp. DQ9]|uniref:PQQ-dependent catabolism-associated CXXCW motif protein n=1 Tax=Novispirillum sp. DQ9 TaxID=3398612 RepID=UPI003C7AE1A5
MRPLLLAALAVLLAAPAEAVEPPDGFRQPPYRGRTPDHAPGAVTVETEAVMRLRRAGAVLIDVTPLTLGTYGALKDRWIETAPHETLPDAHWLPNVGLAAPPPAVEAWFRATLEALTGGDRSRPLVFFCQADCWMSWNAARRAALWGYAAVHWYRDDLDAWRLSLEPMPPGRPRPFAP